MKFRPHISLDVTNLDASIRFYSAVFGIEPTKRRDDYANFRLEEVPLHLALVSQPSHQHNLSSNQHFGIELFEDSQLHAWRERVVSAGLLPRVEESVTCCYAVADKFWLKDPDGNEWEFWVHKDEADSMHGKEAVCCVSECCTPEFETQEPVKTACCS
jgi:catechol-2,3-dioxygenase